MLNRLVLLLMLFAGLDAYAAKSIDLGGTGWLFKATLDGASHPVSVPHCWNLEPAYEKYVGHATYERTFDAPELKPGQIVRLHFDAVYDVAQVWLNGKRLGTHDGGYTPFEFEITPMLQAKGNHLLIDVDNTPTLTSIPALATGVPSTGPARTTIVGWVPYGGITRPVSLLVTDAVYFRTVKMDAAPNLSTGTAGLNARVVLHNGGSVAVSTVVQGALAGLKPALKKISVPPHQDAVVSWSETLPNAKLWSVRDPHLYEATFSVPGDSYSTHFGVRKIEVKGTELLLNGRPVHLYGANRVGEDPVEGPRESDAVIERDMADMLADNMRMMRIAHYPQSQALLDYADRHGMLLIAEAGNWNFSAWQMADPGIRMTFQKQHLEMMEADWNHPSVIAWNVGNEYESYTRSGIEWTRDMRAFTLAHDTTRLISFASRYTSDPAVKTGADEASQYSDFVSINVYGDYAKRFDRAHELYPQKPIFVTEFGRMGEPGEHDPERIANIRTAVEAMKARPWMIGGSLWTWNDYRSFIKGTPEDGIRRWGVVNEHRRHRESWKAVQELFATELP